MHIFQVISSDEKCASAILHIEALIKAEQNLNPGTVGADDDFLDNLFQQGLAMPDVAASANIEGFSFDDTTLDFNDLWQLGIDVPGTNLPEFQ